MSKRSTAPQQKQQTMLDSPQRKDSKSPNSFYQFFIQGEAARVNKQETNNVSLIINAFCQFFFLVHILVAQQLISQEQLAPFLNQIISSAISEVFIYKILQALSVVLKLLIIQSVYMDITNGQQIIGFSQLNKIIFKSFFTIKEVDLLLSGYLLYVSWQQNLPLYVFSLIIDGFYAIYLQNYIIRKDLFYITSSFQNILLRVSMATSTGSNIILVNIKNQFIFTIYHIFFVSGLFTWYYIWGKKIYVHNLINKTLLLMVTVYGAFVFSLVDKLFNGFPVININSIGKLIFPFVVLTAFFILGERKSKTYINKNYNGIVKDYELYISELTQKSNNNQDAKALLFGQFYLHFCIQIPNQQGDLQKEEILIFDPVLKMEINPRQLATQRDSCSRFYCKSFYESSIAHDPLNKKMLLDYSEFLFNQIRNIYSLVQIFQKIEGISLNIIEKTKVSKCKLILKQQNSRLNADLYGGKLQLENIIESQQCFCEIQTKIMNYLQANLQIWSFFLESEIDMSCLHKKLVQNFQLIEQTTKQWMKISKYFHIHKQWKFTYLNFLLFIKNQHIKSKQFDNTKGRNQNNTSIFNWHKIFLDEAHISNEKIFTEDILFDKDSFCIKTHLENSQLVIHQVSRYFERNTMYNSDQIKGTLLEELMSVDIRQNHAKIVVKWISEGYLTDDTAYKVKFTKCIKKNGDDFPVIKYYKLHYNIQNGLQFICLLKQNARSQIIKDDQTNRQTPKRASALLQNIDNQQFMLTSQLEDQFKLLIEPKNFQSQSNIFIKEQTLQPPTCFYIVQNFKASSRIFTIAIIISIVILILINQSDTSNLVSYGSQFIAFMNMYRFPVVLGTNYMKSFLNVGNAKTVASQIASSTSSMQMYTSLSTTRKTLFDPTLVVPATYSPYYQYPWMGNLTYNQIDLFYIVYSSISSLNQMPINRTGLEFQKFNSFLKPSYDNMMNGTKYQLQATFQTIFSKMIQKQLWFMLTQGLIFLIFVVVIFYYVHNSIKKMKNVFLILLDFKLPDRQKITDYWAKLSRSFSSIFLQMHNEGGSTQHLSNRRIQHLTNKFVQQHKRKAMSNLKPIIVEGKNRNQYQCRLRVLIVVITVLILIMAFCLEINIIFSINREQSFQKDGFYFLRYFPTGPLVGYGCMQKYYSQLYPSEITFNPDRYADVMSSMYLFGQFQYIGPITNPSSLYYQKQKNYFYGNPCSYNPSLLVSLNVTVATCQTISNGTFLSGCSSFLRYGQKVGESYMKGQINMTAAQIQNYILSMNILSAYVLDSITTWLNEFNTYVNADFQNNLTLSIVILVLILILHIVINEIIIASKISGDYKFICKVYDHLVPGYILINEKVIRQKFVIEGLINE